MAPVAGSRQGCSTMRSIWVVKSSDIVASQEADSASFYDPQDDKPYRHATFYKVPDEVSNL